jgi:hypothetical protein
MSKKKSRISGQSANKASLVSGQAGTVQKEVPQEFCVSLKHFDPSQGQSFEEWEKAELLAKLLNRWHGHSSKPMIQCFDKKFKIYDAFPENSKFKHPKHVTRDAQWASMHIQSKECIAGHVIGNVFYLVFLDRHHEFWPTDKKGT